MRGNTPPRVPDIEIEDEAEEVVIFDNDAPPQDEFDDDDDSLDELTLEELEAHMSYFARNGRRNRVAERDDAQFTFRKHSGPVFACSLHPQSLDLAATGGEDDRVFVWNIKTGNVILEVKDHRDTVTDVHFSYDGAYLATGDMAGGICVYKMQQAEENEEAAESGISKVWEYSMGDMAWMCWHRAAHVLLAGSELGEVYVWRIPAGDCKVLPGEGMRCEAGKLSSDGKKLYTSYSNGVLKLWDLKNCTVIMEVDNQHPMAHKVNVIAIDCEKESPLFMSGGHDGKILFCSMNGPVAAVEADGPVESVAFSENSELKIAASGTLTGEIAIWDFAKYVLRLRCEHPEENDGITNLKWFSDHILLASTIQGNIFGYDVRSGIRKFSLLGHTADIYNFCYTPSENILLSIAEDHTAKIFNIPQLGD